MARSKNVAGKVITALVALCLIALLIGGIAWFTDGFGSTVKTFAVTVNDELIVNDRDKLEIKSGTRFGVVSPFEGGQYTAEMVTREITNDFVFAIGAESFTWNSDCANKDYTSGFVITTDKDGFVLEYDNITGIIEKANGFGSGIVNVTSLPYGYMFELHIRSANSVIRLGFALEGLAPASITGVELDAGGIIF